MPTTCAHKFGASFDHRPALNRTVTLEQLNLARSRLRLGIANVGFWVLAASAGLCWLASGGAHGIGARSWFIVALAVLGMQAVFDFIGGAWLMPHPAPAAKEFLRRWARGAAFHLAVLTGVGLLSYKSLRLTSGFALAVFVGTVGLALGRRQVFRAMTGASIWKVAGAGRDELAASVSDPAFTGGIVGTGSRATSLWPASWLESLPKSELAVESRRREWQLASGLHDRALIIVLCWNLAGTSLGTFVFGLAQRTPAEALFGHVCWMTLWAFTSLLVLPSLSRGSVLAADRAAADSGLAIETWLMRFPTLTGEDGSANGVAQAVFYPIPSLKMRLHPHADAPLVLGSLARNNLYYSWATLTLLGRAVHCNVGRPALWVFPPAA